MSGIKTRKFKCTGCGEDRPCFLETNQEVSNDVFIDSTEDLKCVLDETNQTSYNWQEIVANDDNTSENSLHIQNVTHRALQMKIEKLEAENKLLAFMVENGLGEQDMLNDITYPHEL